MKTGVFLARMQPLQNAHMWLVGEACKENDQVVVMLGSSNKRDMLRNPFDIELRDEILHIALKETAGKEVSDKVKVFEIPDWSFEGDDAGAKEWGRYFYYNTVARARSKKFSIYYSDDPEIMLNWFVPKIQERINFRFFERTNLFEGLSATKIRKAFEEEDRKYVKKWCPDVVYRRFDELRDIWMDVKKNPKEDFSME
jgi:hypothetical protein